MRARAPFAVLLLLLAPGVLSGCFGLLDEDGAGERTLGLEDAPSENGGEDVSLDGEAGNETAEPRVDPATIRVDVNDSWSVGDQWYYESDRGRWKRVTVEDLSYVNGTPYFTVSTAVGRLGGDANLVTTSTVDAITYNVTEAQADDGSFVTTNLSYPGGGNPELRFLRNGTYAYDEVAEVRGKGAALDWRFRYVVNMRPQRMWNETVANQTCEVAWFKLYVSRWDPEKPQDSLRTWLEERAYCAEIQNDLYTRTSNQEVFRLHGFRLGGVPHGEGLTPSPRR